MVAVRAVAAHGPFPEAEELCGGGGHAAGDSLHGVAAVLIDRAHAVIVGVLVPCGLDEGRHHHGTCVALRLVDGGPLGDHFSGSLVVLADGGADLVAVAFEHVVQAGGHSVGVEGAFGGVGEHGEGAVVGGDDHIALAAHVHHVEAGDLLCVGVAGGRRGRAGGLIDDGGLGAAERLLGHGAVEVRRYGFGAGRVDGVGGCEKWDGHETEQHGNRGKQRFFHLYILLYKISVAKVRKIVLDGSVSCRCFLVDC